MTTLEIRTATGLSKVLIGDSLGSLGRLTEGRRCVAVTDAHVDRLYAASFPACAKVVLEPGEEAKTLATVERLYRGLLDSGADRETFVVAVGGGVVCDLAGFAASTFLRGLPFGFAPTTLLAQVDAAVGGKNGVNFGGYKNLIGVFEQPRFVLCDPDVLRTLPPRELRCGLAEMVKTAAIGDPGLFADLEREAEKALSLDRGFIVRAVEASLRVKAAVVEADEREAGPRRRLNFGHTLGHALESAAAMPHGEAVAAGMAFAAELSVRKGYLAREEAERLKALLERLGLPGTSGAETGAVLDAVRRDKKRGGDAVHFVFLEGLGRPRVQAIPLPELESAIHDLC